MGRVVAVGEKDERVIDAQLCAPLIEGHTEFVAEQPAESAGAGSGPPPELADVSGVNLTRNPTGLMHALQKLANNDQPFAGFNHATAAMCIDDPLRHHESWYHHLFDTHPPIEERIAILDRIAHGQPA